MADYSKYADLTVEKVDRVATVTLNRPDRLNAINHPGLHDELENVMVGRQVEQEVNAIAPGLAGPSRPVAT